MLTDKVHDIEWGFNVNDILTSPRKITGTFHVPTVDKDNEIITEGAMDAAMEDYMHLPIISEYHKERPIGIVTKSWKTNDGKYQFEGMIKSTTDCDDVWEKVQKGEYDMLSIAGKRTESSEECTMHPLMRGTGKPCVTKGLRLDSISACDDGARNPLTSLEMAKANGDPDNPYLYTSKLVLTKVEDTLIKASDTDSSLIHVTTDGTSKRSCKVTKKCNGGKSPELAKSEEEELPESEEKKEEGKEEPKEEKEEAKKADPEPEDEKKAEDPFQEILKILRQLVASDKQVHSEMEKSDKTGEPMEKGLKDGKPGQETPEEVGTARGVTKAGESPVDPAEFAKAMSTISALQAKIEALEGMAVQKAVVVIKETLAADDILESDASVVIKANGGKV
ncbi:hypothetical protein CCP3SC15_420025 [Gammaproteobacteria bacterium]